LYYSQYGVICVKGWSMVLHGNSARGNSSTQLFGSPLQSIHIYSLILEFHCQDWLSDGGHQVVDRQWLICKWQPNAFKNELEDTLLWMVGRMSGAPQLWIMYCRKSVASSGVSMVFLPGWQILIFIIQLTITLIPEYTNAVHSGKSVTHTRAQWESCIDSHQWYKMYPSPGNLTCIWTTCNLSEIARNHLPYLLSNYRTIFMSVSITLYSFSHSAQYGYMALYDYHWHSIWYVLLTESLNIL